MEFSRQHKDSSRPISDGDWGLVRRVDDYRLQVDGSGKIPEMMVPVLLEKGRMLVEEDPERFEATARALIDSARHMHPLDARRFLRDKITPETFEFQARFEELRAPSSVTLSGLCGIHVNTVPRFLNLRDSEIAPICKRMKRGWDKEDPDSYRVCFASGKVDLLAQFLVGHALLRKPIEPGTPKCPESEKNPWMVNLAEWWALEPTRQTFAEKFAIAILSGKKLPASDDYLDILSPVRKSLETVDFIAVTEPTKVGVERMPHTVLLPEQVGELRRESCAYLKGTVRQERRTDVGTFPDQYVVTAHAELVMKFRLLKVYEGLMAQGGRPPHR